MRDRAHSVLILDDEQAVRESLAYYFEDCGWRVLSAESAEDALNVISRDSVDGMVVDIRLPDMNGNDFICVASKLFPTLASVICTGSPEYRVPIEVETLPQVSDQVFTKPVLDLAPLEEELHRMVALFFAKP